MATSTQVHKPKRRKLRFRQLDDILAEAERLNRGPYQIGGSWSLGQSLKHLGLAMMLCVGEGNPFKVPLLVKVVGRTVYRPIMLHWYFPSGFKLPKRAAAVLVPQEPVSYEEGLETMRMGMERMAEDPNRVAHPVIGPLNAAQWNLLHLRHAELHLGYLVPE
jgi:hypothetical protein